MDKRKLTIAVLSRVILAFPVLGLMFFWPAGTLNYWEAWVYIGILLIPVGLATLYLLKHDPDLLERRMRTREGNSEQGLLIISTSIFLIVAFLMPGFDKRFGWSNTPVWLVIAADVFVLLGYSLFFLVLRENSFASRVVEVEAGQKVISSGPYALVRHPMYVAILLMFAISPLALGSLWGMLPMILMPVILVLRILNEETVLREGLEGYQEYTQKVKYRLIPGIW